MVLKRYTQVWFSFVRQAPFSELGAPDRYRECPQWSLFTASKRCASNSWLYNLFESKTDHKISYIFLMMTYIILKAILFLIYNMIFFNLNRNIKHKNYHWNIKKIYISKFPALVRTHENCVIRNSTEHMMWVHNYIVYMYIISTFTLKSWGYTIFTLKSC